jgi:hypothetical protein
MHSLLRCDVAEYGQVLSRERLEAKPRRLSDVEEIFCTTHTHTKKKGKKNYVIRNFVHSAVIISRCRGGKSGARNERVLTESELGELTNVCRAAEA